MANIDAPSGFRPVRHLDGSPYNGATRMMLFAAADATACFVGDVVIVAGSAGTVGQTVNGIDVEGIMTVTRATSGTVGQSIAGVVVGFLPDVATPDLMLKHRAASTLRLAMVCTDMSVVYEVQEDADTTPLAAVDIGLNISFTTTAGSTTTGISAMELDSSAKATTSTLPFKLIGLVKKPNNNFNTGGSAVDPAKFEVVLNASYWAPNIAGI